MIKHQTSPIHRAAEQTNLEEQPVSADTITRVVFLGPTIKDLLSLQVDKQFAMRTLRH